MSDKMNWDRMHQEGRDRGVTPLSRSLSSSIGQRMLMTELDSLSDRTEGEAARILSVIYPFSYNRSLRVIRAHRRGDHASI